VDGGCVNKANRFVEIRGGRTWRVEEKSSPDDKGAGLKKGA